MLAPSAPEPSVRGSLLSMRSCHSPHTLNPTPCPPFPSPTLPTESKQLSAFIVPLLSPWSPSLSISTLVVILASYVGRARGPGLPSRAASTLVRHRPTPLRPVTVSVDPPPVTDPILDRRQWQHFLRPRRLVVNVDTARCRRCRSEGPTMPSCL